MNPYLQHHLPRIQPLLKQWYETKKVAPALLLTGLDGIGKSWIANYLAQWLNCEVADQSKSKVFSPLVCQKCVMCKKAEKNALVDLYRLQPEVSEEKTGKIKIDQLQSLLKDLGHGPMEAAYKTVILDPSDAMTPQAANALLKTLEEPPADWVFILTARHESNLLPTLLSRCQRLRLLPFSEAELLTITQDTTVARLAQGSLQKALQLKEGQGMEVYQKAQRFLQNPQKEWESSFECISKNMEDFNAFLSELERALHSQEAVDKRFMQFQLIQDTRFQLETPCNKKLLAQYFLGAFL